MRAALTVSGAARGAFLGVSLVCAALCVASLAGCLHLLHPAGVRVARGSWGDLRLDGGLAVVGRFMLFGDAPGVRPFAILSLERHDWTLGVWGDRVRYPGAVKRCDEDCDPDDYLKSHAGAGISLERRF